MTDIELTEKEVQEIAGQQNVINQNNLALGLLRRQYLDAENRLLENIRELEDELMNSLKYIFKSKTNEDIKDWKFDPVNFIFKKV